MAKTYTQLKEELAEASNRRERLRALKEMSEKSLADAKMDLMELGFDNVVEAQNSIKVEEANIAEKLKELDELIAELKEY